MRNFLFEDGDDGGDESNNTSSSCEVCGWAATCVAMLAFGSFGVPIKSKVATSLHIDPLVMQTYKTGMCFLTSWLFLYVRNEKITFTPMGLLSGLFWVPGGIATIYAIQTAGIATAMSVGSSVIVLVSFMWGIFVFEEHVHDKLQACLAIACMVCGLCGMAYYSAPTIAHSSGIRTTTDTTSNTDPYHQPLRPTDDDFLPLDDDDDAFFGRQYVAMESTTTTTEGNNDIDDDDDDDDGNIDMIENPSSPTTGGIEDNENSVSGQIDDNDSTLEPLLLSTPSLSSSSSSLSSVSSSVILCGGYVKIQERILGIIVAVFGGLWGGSMMVPMQFAPKGDQGLPFLTSFAIGAVAVTMFCWIFRYGYLVCHHNFCGVRAYKALPSFYFRQMWPYGMTCGVIWSIGNFCSILSVEFLGEGIGYASTQAAMLISGLWGIFYFREIEGTNAISKWLLCASCTVLGILILSYEHHEP